MQRFAHTNRQKKGTIRFSLISAVVRSSLNDDKNKWDTFLAQEELPPPYSSILTDRLRVNHMMFLSTIKMIDDRLSSPRTHRSFSCHFKMTVKSKTMHRKWRFLNGNFLFILRFFFSSFPINLTATMTTTMIIHHSPFPIHHSSTPITSWFRSYDILDDRLNVLHDVDLMINSNETIGFANPSYSA